MDAQTLNENINAGQMVVLMSSYTLWNEGEKRKIERIWVEKIEKVLNKSYNLALLSGN